MVECNLYLLDYLINLAIFSLLVVLPLVFLGYKQYQPLKHYKLWIGLYGGVVSFLLVRLAIHQEGYSYDLRYAPVILVFTYFGPIPGFLTGIFALAARLIEGGNLLPVIIGWSCILLAFTLTYPFIKHLRLIKKLSTLFIVYTGFYLLTVQVFQIMVDNPFFHFEYVLFVLFAVILGSVLLESYTKLYRMNQKLSKLYKLVAESESNYRLIAENTSDLILVISEDKKISYLSPSHHSVLGYDCAHFMNMKLGTLLHPDDKEMFLTTIDKMFTTKKSSTLEFRLQHQDGHWIEFESRCKPVVGENDRVKHIVNISRDITERKKSEELLLQSEKLSIVGELAAGVAHEIRNPLTTIKGFVQLNRVVGGSVQYNDLVLSELERIESITTELLSLGKPQAVTLSQTNLGRLVENTLEIMAPQAVMSNIEIEFQAPDEPIFITCEQNQVKQVFLNILKNAMEAMPSGGGIRVELKKSGEDQCQVRFQDSGYGIPEELLPRLGEPFYTLKEKGTGLGLMICHKIIQQHHGQIHYRSKVGEGTTVEITLPTL